MNADYLAGIQRAIEIVMRDGLPGPGGIDMTGGIPSEIFIGIGRERYDDEGGDYELAKDTAASVRAGILAALRHEVSAVSLPAPRR